MANEKIYEIKLPDASYDIFGKGLIYDADETISITYNPALFDGSWHIISNGLALTRPVETSYTFAIYAAQAEGNEDVVGYGYTIEAMGALTLQQGPYSNGGKIRISESISLIGTNIYCNGILNLTNAAIAIEESPGSQYQVLTTSGSGVYWSYPTQIYQYEYSTDHDPDPVYEQADYPILFSQSPNPGTWPMGIYKDQKTFTFVPGQTQMFLGSLCLDGKAAAIRAPGDTMTIEAQRIVLQGEVYSNQRIVLTDDNFAYDSTTGTLTITI